MIYKEEYKILDQLNEKKKNSIGPVGFARCFLGNNLVFEGFNMVVAKGREFVNQKIFNTIAYNGGNRTDLRGFSISHFGIGSGGASIVNDQVVLNGPHSTDIGLYQPISLKLGDVAYLNDPSNYNAGDGIHAYTDAVKPISTNGSIYLEPETYDDNGVVVQYSTTKCTCVLPAGEPYVLDTGQNVQVSEAALYLISGSTVYLFSHICFAPKYKEKDIPFTIIWYIIC